MMKQTVMFVACLALLGGWIPTAAAADADVKAPDSADAGVDPSLLGDVPAADDKSQGDAKAEKARDIQIPLETKAKVVEKRLYPKAMKHELGVFFGIDPMDPYVFGIVEGARYVFHPVEYLGVQVSGAAVQTINREDADYLKDKLTIEGKNFESSRLQWMGDADVIFYPLYGKFALLGDVVLHYDTGVYVGGGVVGAKSGDIYPSADVGLMSNVYLTKWMSLRGDLTYYGVIAKDKREDMATGKKKDNTLLRSHLLLTVGLSFHLPVD